MDVKKLLSGVAVIIDDKINDKDGGDKIIQIKQKLKNENIPFIEYEDIPGADIIQNFINISFVLLDWELFQKPEPGILIDEEPFIEANINFIRNIQSITFTPLFIFSRLPPGDIIRILSEKGLYNEGINNHIFVKSKDELLSDDDENKIFSEIENWLIKVPSVYVLKEWELAQNTAKNKLFWTFYNINHYWPSVLQKSYIDDGSDVNYELGSFISKNILARTEPINFDTKILELNNKGIDKKDIRKILEAERFINNDSLPKNPFTGDLFMLYKYEISENATSAKELYYLNIRPECDIIRNSNPELYCLECEILDESKINSGKDNQILFQKGNLIEKVNTAFIPFIDGKIFTIKFNEIKIFSWAQELCTKATDKNKRKFNQTRIGRILPPFITKVQQKYAFYLQRQGLPAIPVEALETFGGGK